MVLIISNGSCSTVPLTPATGAELLKCESVTRYKECGYYCAIGWNGDKQVIRVHANNDEEIDRALGFAPESGECDDCGNYIRA